MVKATLKRKQVIKISAARYAFAERYVQRASEINEDAIPPVDFVKPIEPPNHATKDDVETLKDALESLQTKLEKKTEQTEAQKQVLLDQLKDLDSKIIAIQEEQVRVPTPPPPATPIELPDPVTKEDVDGLKAVLETLQSSIKDSTDEQKTQKQMLEQQISELRAKLDAQHEVAKTIEAATLTSPPPEKVKVKVEDVVVKKDIEDLRETLKSLQVCITQNNNDQQLQKSYLQDQLKSLEATLAEKNKKKAEEEPTEDTADKVSKKISQEIFLINKQEKEKEEMKAKIKEIKESLEELQFSFRKSTQAIQENKETLQQSFKKSKN